MEQQQISPKKQKALDKVKRANAELAKIVREENVIDTLKMVRDAGQLGFILMNFTSYLILNILQNICSSCGKR